MSDSAGRAGGAATAVFRIPRSAYLAVLFLVLGVSVLVRGYVWLPIYLVPVLAALFVARRATLMDADSVTVRALFGSRRVAWDNVLGLVVDERGSVSASLRSGGILRLPYVRAGHLGALHALTSGRIPTIDRPAPVQPSSSAVEDAQ